MPSYIDTFNQIISLGIIVLQLLAVILLVNLVFFRSRTNSVLVFFKENAFWGVFLVSLGSVAVSLFYSNIIGFPPCELCWMQRIFLYPQAILFGMALYKHDRNAVDYGLALASIGSFISVLHVYVENGGASTLACATGSATTVSCATRYVFEFGYITVPVMALSAGVFIILLLCNYKYITRT